MKRNEVLVFVSIMICMVLTACSSNNDDQGDVIIPQEESRYYIKYEVSSNSKYPGIPSANGIRYEQTITFTTEKGQEKITKSGHSVEWEGTYGPFKKGVSISLNVTTAVNNHARIYASRDKESFVIKAEDTQTNHPIQLSYKIDF